MSNPNRDYKGRFTHGLADSLEQQLRAKGHDAEKARALAVEILVLRGHMSPVTGRLTAEGLHRQSLGREERRKDRAARQLGYESRHMGYDKRTGKAYVK